ncbi:MAG: quinone-dependent dihydroorotate dehydrogenase [Hyphomicrobiaceae bacterium]|nr:quinone-dependent dihydroorotate dehydrogenase [Hyphomicrobiaceae bacterium]
MSFKLFDLIRPALFALAPEDAHEATLKALEAGAYLRQPANTHTVLAQTVMGLTFANPVGIAAGFDKDARVPDAVLGLGCGFAEIGTVTPRAQAGNARPRVFRLVEDGAIINRLGFNNGGHDAAHRRLSARRGGGIVGVNIGANKDSEDRAADYVAGIERFYGLASYFTVNISSPNTPGLRDLQAPAALDDLVGRVMAARAALTPARGRPVPIVVKVAPDIAEDDVGPIAERLIAHGVDGVAVSNTTLARRGLRSAQSDESGGLSGRPLFHRSTVMLARFRQATGGRLPIIGIGGIDSGERALAKIEAGASLIQLYTGLVYEGPELIGRINAHLAATCRREGLASIRDLVGRRATEWAGQRIDG